MNPLALTITIITIVILLAAAYTCIRFSRWLAHALEEYIPQPGNHVEQRILNDRDGG